MKSLIVASATLGLVLLTAACSGGSSGGGAAQPSTSLPSSAATARAALFPVSTGPTGGSAVTHGATTISMPSTFTQQGGESRQSTSTSVGYTSNEQSAGKRAAIVVAWSNGKDTKSAKQEAEAFHGELLDVEHVEKLRMVKVSWPGLSEAYQFSYSDPSVTPAAASLVLMGETVSGQFVSVTAKAPPALLAPLQVELICGSLRVHVPAEGT